MSFEEDKASLDKAINAKLEQISEDNQNIRSGNLTDEQFDEAWTRREQNKRELMKMYDERNQQTKYSQLGEQASIVPPITPETVGVKGAIRVPAATTYEDSQTSLTEVAAYEGDLATASKAQNIEICGFLSDISLPDIDIAAPQLGIPALQDLAKAINGVSLPVLEFAAKPIVDVFGGASKAIGDLASAIQSSIPTITCGAKEPELPVEVDPGVGSALTPLPPVPPAPTVPPVGITPTITVSSPTVTVQALNDVLDAGEI